MRELDFEKLEPIKKLKPKKTETNLDAEKAVQSIHTPAPEKERLKRITIDLPFSIYKEIRKKTVEEDNTLRNYFIELAIEDLNS